MGEFTHLKWFTKGTGLGYCSDMKHFAVTTGLVVARSLLQAKSQPTTGNAQELAMAQSQIKSLLKENELLRAGASQSKATTTGSKENEMELSAAKARATQLAMENQSLQARLQAPAANNDSAAQAL